MQRITYTNGYDEIENLKENLKERQKENLHYHKTIVNYSRSRVSDKLFYLNVRLS